MVLLVIMLVMILKGSLLVLKLFASSRRLCRSSWVSLTFTRVSIEEYIRPPILPKSLFSGLLGF